MRKLVMAALMLGAVQSAQAADLPDLPFLRGSFTDAPIRPYPVWQGYYIGGQAGYGSSNLNFSGSNPGVTARLVANTIIENEMGISGYPLSYSPVSRHVSGFGGFAGYNSQWDDVVIGVESSYLHGRLGGESSAGIRRGATLSDKNYHDVTSVSTKTADITDIATFRARAAYAIGGFLPYMFGGLALGYGDLYYTATVNDTITTPSNQMMQQPQLTRSEGRYGQLLYGYTAGVGVDVNLLGGLFLRAEYEYIRFTAATDTNISTGRVGLGYKF